METIDIAPRFTVAGAKLVEEKQNKLHQAVISVAEMMQEMVRSGPHFQVCGNRWKAI